MVVLNTFVTKAKQLKVTLILINWEYVFVDENVFWCEIKVFLFIQTEFSKKAGLW